MKDAFAAPVFWEMANFSRFDFLPPQLRFSSAREAGLVDSHLLGTSERLSIFGGWCPRWTFLSSFFPIRTRGNLTRGFPVGFERPLSFLKLFPFPRPSADSVFLTSRRDPWDQSVPSFFLFVWIREFLLASDVPQIHLSDLPCSLEPPSHPPGQMSDNPLLDSFSRFGAINLPPPLWLDTGDY